ncbi:MAG TPA: 50S ribosomal protein L28 [Candidatus Dormibacteraeota bacterium]|nr:50S ribosomal protein L28 [Candidatus Dormibacteraeota bacterium]
MAVCQICGKRPQFGNKVARLGKNAVKRRVKARVKRTRKPNVQRIAVWMNGASRRMYVCTACIRSGRVVRPPERPRGG